MVPEPSGQMA